MNTRVILYLALCFVIPILLIAVLVHWHSPGQEVKSATWVFYAGGPAAFCLGCIISKKWTGHRYRAVYLVSRYRSYLVLGVFAGFVLPFITITACRYTAFMTMTGSVILWEVLTGTIAGLGVGRSLGLSYEMTLDWNRTPNLGYKGATIVPVVAGNILGSIAFVQWILPGI